MYLSQNIFYNLQYWLYQKVANTKIARKFRVYFINFIFIFDELQEGDSKC